MSEGADSLLLLGEIDALKEAVRVLTGRLAEVETLASVLSDPLGRVFIARSPKTEDGANAASTGFVEQTVNRGQVEDFPDGRQSLEAGDAGNLVDPGGAFAVIEVEDFDADGNRVTRFVPIRSGAVTINLTSNMTGGGKYRGKRVKGTLKPTASQATWEAANLTFPEAGLTLPQDEDCYVVNWAEIGESGHALTESGASRRTHLCFPYGTAPDGKPIYETYAHGILDCFT